jgi:hypothetical protein
MRATALLASLALAAVAACSAAQAPDPSAPLALERTIDLPRVRGRIDHLAYDAAHRRLIVAELGNGSVEMVPLDGGPSRRIPRLEEPQGVAWLPKEDEIAVASGGDGTLRLFDAALKPVATLKLGEDADDVRVDEAGRLFVGYGAGGIAIVGPARRAVIARIALPAHPEGLAIDTVGRRAFINVPGASRIAVAALDQGRVAASWPATHRANFPMALSRTEGLLAIAYRAPARLALLDLASGAVKQDLATCGDADDVYFDERRSRLYVSCGAGRIDVFARDDSGFAPAAQVETRSGARTSLFVPALDRLFVAAPAAFPGRDAAILVYRPR